MLRLAPLLVAVWLLSSAVASAQFKNVFSFSEDAAAASGMQLYFDFDPNTVAAPALPPPQGPGDADLLVIVMGLPPAIGPVTSTSFAVTVAETINSAFRDNEWFDPGLYFAKVREGVKSEEKSHDASIEIQSPVDLYAVFTSSGSGSAPSTLLSGPPGNSHNPTISLRTPEIRAAFPGGLNSQLIVNGANPADNDFHLVEQEAPGTLSLDFLGLPFAPVTLMSSTQYNPGNFDLSLIGIPGSIDIGTTTMGGVPGGIHLIFDGFTGLVDPITDPFRRTDANGIYTVNYNLAPGQFLGNTIALQGFVFDPAVLAGFSATQAADVHFASGRTVDLALGDDATAMVQFAPGKTFEFYGTSYTRLFVNSNGFITFGAPSSLAATFLIDPTSALQAEPGLFVHMADYNPTTSIVEYREFGSEARVRWGSLSNPVSHNGQIDQAVFSTTLHLTVPAGTTPPSQDETHDNVVMSTAINAGSIFFDWLQLDTVTALPASSFDAFVGISPGGVPNASMVPSRDFGEIQAPSAPLPMQPIVSLDNFTNTALGPISVASGGGQAYNNGAGYAGSSVGFYPIDLGGSPGYYSIPDENRADDFQGVNVNQLSISQNMAMPLNFVLFGKFKYFDRRATSTAPPSAVELFESSTMTLVPLMPLQIFSDTQPPNPPGPQDTPIAPIPPAAGIRDFEALQVEVPLGALSSPGLGAGQVVDVLVTFPTGELFVLQGAITLVP